MAVDVLTGEDEMFDRLFVVTDDAVYVSNPDKEKLSGITSQLREGAAVTTVVPDAEEIRHSAISSVKANKFRDDLNIYHRQGSRTRMKNATFRDSAARDIALAALARRLAPRFQKREVQYGAVRAALAPLLTAGGIAAFTYVSVQAAAGLAAGEEVDIRGRARGEKRMFAWALEILGPTGIGIVGSLLVLGCIAWLVARLKQPPLMITLSPSR
jgi:hypothetical protein